jgi:hypothetical protein
MWENSKYILKVSKPHLNNNNNNIVIITITLIEFIFYLFKCFHSTIK